MKRSSHRSRNRNDMGRVALWTGIAAAVAAFVPFVGDYISVPLAVAAVITGWIGVGRADSGDATNGRDAMIGASLGLLALAMVAITTAAAYTTG